MGLVITVALILAGPAALTLRSGFSFLLASRARRFTTLTRIGVPERRLARLFASECTVLTAFGLGLGFAAFQLTQAWLGRSAWLSVTWFPKSGDGYAIVFGLLVAVSSGLAWRAAMRIFTKHQLPKFSPAPRPSRRLGQAAGAAVIVATGSLLGMLGYGVTGSPASRQSETLTFAILAAITLGTVGMIVGIPNWSRQWAAKSAAASSLPVLGLGLRGAAYFSKPGARFLVALVLLSVLSGLSSGFITGVGRWGEGYQSSQTVSIENLPSLNEATLERLLQELPIPFVVLASDASDSVLVAGDCAGVNAFDLQAGSPEPQCLPDLIQSGDELGLAAKAVTEVSLGDGQPALAVPHAAPARQVRWSVKLPESYAERLTRFQGASLIIPTPDVSSQLAAMAFLVRNFPQVPFQSGLKDPDSYEIYAAYSAVFRVAFAAAFAMTAGALSFLALELAWSHTRQSRALAALGLSPRQLRTAAGIQAVWPVLAVVPALLFGILSGYSMRSYFGTRELWEPEIPLAVLTPWLLAAVLAFTVGARAPSVRFQRDAVSDA